MDFLFTTEVKVVRTGSHNQRAASGTTKIQWVLTLGVEGSVGSQAGLSSAIIKVIPQNLDLKLDSWNDDTDQDDNWTESLDLSSIKVKLESNHSSENILKQLENGLRPKELHIWNGQVSLVF